METIRGRVIIRSMKHVFTLATSLLLSGCAKDVTSEEHDFFYRGWVHPERGSQERMLGRKYAGRLNPDDSPRHPLPGTDRPF